MMPTDYTPEGERVHPTLPAPGVGIEDLRKERPSIAVLQDCIALQRKKSQDYQNPNSRVKQADYYPHGLQSILDIIHAKYLRIISVMEAMENDPNYEPNFESLEDSLKDLINYASFGAAWIKGEIPGQESTDLLNRPGK